MTQFPASVPNAWRLPKRLAYVVDHSLPYSSDGYAVRTHEISRAMVECGFDVVVFNRPGRPWDIPGFDLSIKVPLDMTLEGVRYIFLPSFDQPSPSPRDQLGSGERALHEAMQVFRPAAIMAASNWENARPAANVARRLCIPFLYEIRGFWEMSRAASDPDYSETSEYQNHRMQEADVANGAMAVLTLTEAMRTELVRRGVAPERIRLVPNGVRSRPPQAPILRRSHIRCETKHLLGYVGSLSAYEGVDDLVRLTALMRGEGTDVAALIVGSGAPAGVTKTDSDDQAVTSLKKLARELGVADYIHFIPRIPWNNVGGYYALCDAIIIPRRRSKVTEIVAPLKPYDAAAYGVPVFMSDIPLLQNLAADIHASLFREGDLADLADQLRQCFGNSHAMVVDAIPKGSYWRERIRPLAGMMTSISAEELVRQNAQAVNSTALNVGVPLFDLEAIPEAVFAPERVLQVAGIGPCRKQRGRASSFTALTRSNLHSHLALAPPGIFVVDWAGLQSVTIESQYDEWAELWTIADMRMNRQMMDACRIAVSRGWRLVVLGPIHGSTAPLFRTVSGLFEVITPFEEELI